MSLKEQAKTSKEVIDAYVGTDKWKLDYCRELASKLNLQKWVPLETAQNLLQTEKDVLKATIKQADDIINDLKMEVSKWRQQQKDDYATYQQKVAKLQKEIENQKLLLIETLKQLKLVCKKPQLKKQGRRKTKQLKSW